MISSRVNVNLLTIMFTKVSPFLKTPVNRTFSSVLNHLASETPRRLNYPITPVQQVIKLAKLIDYHHKFNGHRFIFDSEPDKDVNYINTIMSMQKFCSPGALGCTIAAKYPKVAFGHAYELSYKANKMPIKLVAGADYDAIVQQYEPKIDLQSSTFFNVENAPIYSRSYDETHFFYQEIVRKAGPYLGPMMYATHNISHWELAAKHPKPVIAVLYGAHDKLAHFVKKYPHVKGLVYIPVGDDGGFYNERRFKEISASNSGLRSCLLESKSFQGQLIGQTSRFVSTLPLKESNVLNLGKVISPIAKKLEKYLFLVSTEQLHSTIKELKKQNLSAYVNPLFKENSSFSQRNENLNCLDLSISQLEEPTFIALKPSTLISG